MVLDGARLTKNTDTAAKSAGQDQTARMCRLILLYTLYKNESVVTKGRIRN